MLERIGRLIYRRRWHVLIAWALVIAVALPLAPQAPSNLKPGGFTNEDFPSAQAREVLRDRLGVATLSTELLFQHPDWTAYQPQFIDAVQQAIEPLRGRPEVLSIQTHLDDAARVSQDGHTARVTVGMNVDLEEATEFTESHIATLDTGPLDMTTTGGPALYRDLSLASERDLARGERVAFPLATIVLLLVFGTLIAAVTPVAVGGVGTLIGLAAVFVISQGADMSVFALNIVTLLGIGMGIDYSLFYTSRFREELEEGKSVPDAIASCQSTAGRAVLFSAITSLVGLTSLLFFDIVMLRSVGIGAVAVIFAALVAAMTLLPAVLSVLGHRVNRFNVRPPWRRRPEIWGPLARWVMARPVTVLVPTVGLLVLLVLPVTHLRLGTVDATILPDSLESRQGFDILQEEFGFAPSTFIPVAYTFDGDPFADDNLERLYALGDALQRLPNVDRVSSIVNVDPTLGLDDYRALYAEPGAVTDPEVARLVREAARPGAALFLVESGVHPFSPEAGTLISEMRALVPPGSDQLHVDGGSADLKDILDSLYGMFPWVVAAVVLVTYVSLLILFRSVLLPLKAVILNVLSILASYGALVFVFQDGNFSGLLGFEPLGVIEATTPILLFAIIFGLSMDYEIFLLSRISEAHRDGADNTTSVSEGLQKSGLIITGAAAILVVVAGSFVLADVVVVKAIGLGLAIAVLVDVTLVRALAAPAIMRLAGSWNWYLPRWLDHLIPEVRHGG